MHIIRGVTIEYHSRSDDQILEKIGYGVLVNRSDSIASKICKGRSKAEIE
jgi:hypothetical protein